MTPFTAAEIERCRLPLEQAHTLPPAAYTAPEVFAQERSEVFAKHWICVARAEQLAGVGDYVCVDLPGAPIVVARGRDETLRALSRVCLHRAMPVAEGCGNATRFVCPYHKWTYELDGSLRSAPMMDGVDGFDASELRLPEVRLEIWHGFVFVNLDQNAQPVSELLKGLERHVQAYDIGRLVVAATIEYDSPWNWKLLTENFMEAYHHIGTHQTSLEPTYPARESSVPDNEGAPWTLLKMPVREGLPEDESIPALPGLSEDERRQLLAANVFPTLLFAPTPYGCAWYELNVSSHDHMHLKIHMLLPPELVEHLDDDAREHVKGLLRVVHEEDIDANRGPWLGLQGSLTQQGRLSRFEKAIWQQNQLWLDSMGW